MSMKLASLPPNRIAYKQGEVAKLMGISVPTWHKLRRAGMAPAPDISLGSLRLWSRDTLETWIASRTQAVASDAS
jgi:predicted DNA-binding transcriptional regulator AlpA